MAICERIAKRSATCAGTLRPECGLELNSAAGSARGRECRSHLRIDGQLGPQGERPGELRPCMLHHGAPGGGVRVARIEEPRPVAGEDFEHRIEDLAHHAFRVVASLDRAVDAVHRLQKPQMRPALVLGALALGQVQNERDGLGACVIERRSAYEHSHAAAILAEVLLLEGLAPANGPCLLPCPLVGGQPFDRRDVRPAQPPRCQVVLAVTEHAQECFIRLENGAVEVCDHHPDDVGVDQAPELAFPFL